jgi:peptide/nickel transport system substrate-binding protein
VEAPTGDFNSGKAAIGTGPFRFGEFVPNDRVVLTRNDAYWGDRPAWGKVTLKLISNNAARTAALLAGDVQMIEAVPSADVPRLRSNNQIALHRITSNRVIYLAFDQARDQTPFLTDKAGAVLPNNPLKDVRVRQAISKAINRQGSSSASSRATRFPRAGCCPKARSAPRCCSSPTRSTRRARASCSPRRAIPTASR